MGARRDEPHTLSFEPKHPSPTVARMNAALVTRSLQGGCLSLVALATACAPQTSDARIGAPRPPRNAACTLKVVPAMTPATLNASDQVSVVRLSNVPAGTDQCG
jgi:hypothetical protein